MEISVFTPAKIFNQLVVGKYNHQALTNEFTKKERRKLEGITGAFIRTSGSERTARKQFFNKVETRGLKLKNLEFEETDYRLKYLRRLQESTHPAKELGEMVL